MFTFGAVVTYSSSLLLKPRFVIRNISVGAYSCVMVESVDTCDLVSSSLLILHL
jgi:hypothetical protein